MTRLPEVVHLMVSRVDLSQPTTASIRSRALLSTVGVAAQGALRLATVVLIGHLATPAVVGVVGPALGTGAFLSLLWPTSAGSAASKYVARSRGSRSWDEAAGIAAFIGRRSLVAAVLLALLGLLWSAIRHHDLPTGLCVGALVLGYSCYSFVRGVQFGGGQLARATAWDVVSAGLALVALVIALLAGVRGTALVLPLAGGYLLYAVAGWPRRSPHRLAPALRREIDHFVLIGVSGTLASSGFLQLTQVVAKEVDTPTHVGYYTEALALATPPSLIAGALSLVLFPSMAEAWGRQDFTGFRRHTDQAMRLMVICLVAVFGTLILCSRLVVAVVLKPKYAPSAELLPILLLATMAASLAVVASNSLATRSRRGMMVTSGASMVGFATGATVWALTAPSGGVHAIARGYLCGALVIAIIPITVVVVLDRPHWGWLLSRLTLAVICLLSLRRLQVVEHLPVWSEPLLATVFVAGWLAVSWNDVRARLLPILRRR